MKSAIAETDVPEALPEFISQRRRWLNGSFFAATYAIAHLGQILHSGHSVWRKVALVVETIYNVINLIAAWFAVVRSPPGRKSRNDTDGPAPVGKLLSILCESSWCDMFLRCSTEQLAGHLDFINRERCVWHARNQVLQCSRTGTVMIVLRQSGPLISMPSSSWLAWLLLPSCSQWVTNQKRE